MTENFLQFMRYGMVGVVNTLLTFVSFVLLRHIGVGLDLSNFLSFSLGMICSFTLNKLWAFRARGGSVVNEALFFFCGSIMCWGIQWVVFRGLLLLLPELVAQLGGMAVYTSLGFIFNKMVTFRRRPETE